MNQFELEEIIQKIKEYDNNYIPFAAKIGQIMKEHNLSQNELAAEIGVTGGAISRIIKESRIPKADNMRELQKAFPEKGTLEEWFNSTSLKRFREGYLIRLGFSKIEIEEIMDKIEDLEKRVSFKN